ncbi:MAG: LysR family transcriptional regulator, partial [Gemmatimonadaceae bacterium]|nr:LysR family transcriptional regulator [Gloeobacterales cyanobacterium ES-bin-141]
TLEGYLASQHLLVSLKEDFTGRVDLQLARSDLRRYIALSVPHFLAAIHVLARTDLVAALPVRVAHVHAELLGLQTLLLPLSVPGFTVSMLWHSRQTGEPGHDWLRSQLDAVCRL